MWPRGKPAVDFISISKYARETKKRDGRKEGRKEGRSDKTLGSVPFPPPPLLAVAATSGEQAAPFMIDYYFKKTIKENRPRGGVGSGSGAGGEGE